MLEFQEGFFEQEVRDGFYIDTTMKTVWAAELEVLQKVAEVCDKYDLKWYAAYGTLLGAIRHEGFVPWDDDMDIWMKRKDYNKLMQVLPKELPEGYLVRSPMTGEGYNQFHTCINSGSGISIAKDWLEQFHGCPFTVGLDIFPLDYLPRDEQERELQRNLFVLAGRVAQLAKNIGRGDYDSSEDEEQALQRVKEDIIEGILYLESNCNLKLESKLLEEERWDELSSQLWKWANYLAMMYSEEESDYIVEYLDYIQYEYKVYPKEWFRDGYYASFETFMIPIPAGYDCLLRYIYGDYFVRRKKTGMHEYPYYARQLRQLREYVKNVEHRVLDLGLISIDEIEVRKENVDIPEEWFPLTVKDGGMRKKIILSANDSTTYVNYGVRALEQLEMTFRSFEKVKDSILLWWRPQPVMRKQLEQISPELGARYQKILEQYRNAGWGICDETDNIDRAVEVCDIYYGDMNPILQQFQDAGKPIMLTTIEKKESDRREYNRERLNEFRVFLSLADFAEDDDKIYFANTNYNALVIVNKETWTIAQFIPFEGIEPNAQNMHLRCIKKQNKICFLPAGIPLVHIYDIENGTQHTCKFRDTDEEETPQESWDYFECDDNQVYLLPCNGRQELWKWKVPEDALERECWWKLSPVNSALQHGGIDEKSFYTLVVASNQLYITDIVAQTIDTFSLPDEHILHITYDGQNFWYTMEANSDIVCWNKEQGVVDRYQMPLDTRWENGFMAYLEICYMGGNLFLFSKDNQSIYVLNQDARKLKRIHSIECARGAFFAREVEPSFKCIDNKLICLLKNAGDVVVIDLKSMEARQYNESFQIDEKIQEYEYGCLLNRNVLLLEEPGVVDLDMLLRHYMS